MEQAPFKEIPIPPGLVVFNSWALPAPNKTQFYGALVMRTEDLLSRFEGLSAIFKQQYDNSAATCDDIAAASIHDIMKAVEKKGRPGRRMLDPQEMIRDFTMLTWAMCEGGHHPKEMKYLCAGGSFSLSLIYLDAHDKEMLSRALLGPGREPSSPVAVLVDSSICRVRECDAPMFAKRLDDARALTATIH